MRTCHHTIKSTITTTIAMITQFLRKQSQASSSSQSSTPSPAASPSPAAPAARESSEASKSTPPTTNPLSTHKVQFPIKEGVLFYEKRLLKNVQYRPKTIRQAAKGHKPSWVWEYGAEVSADKYDRLWVCQRCYERRSHGQYVFDARKATSAIAYRLEQQHSISNPSKPQTPSTPQSDYISAPFSDLLYKQQLCDWITYHDISFRIVRFTDTYRLFCQRRREIEAIYPKSDTTLVKWIKELYYKRKEVISSYLRNAASKINISADGWRSDCRDNYIAVCSHFVSADGYLRHILLGFKKIKTRKTGANQAVLVKQLLDEYCITDLGSQYW